MTLDTMAACVWSGRSAAPATPAMQAALFTSLGLVLLVLTVCVVFGVVLYRRSVTPLPPHLQLLEDLEEF